MNKRASLRRALNNLRQQLGTDALLADRDTVQLNPDFPLWVDTREFQPIADSRLPIAEREFAISHLPSALSDYAELLPAFYDEWIFPVREEYRAQYLDALVRSIENARAASEYTQAIALGQKILAIDRAHEEAHQHLMFCYAALGNRSAALAQYDACASALRDELGVEPSTETRALYASIQKQEETGSRAARLTNLPKPLTSFVGRERELNEIRALLGRGEASRSVSVAERTMHSPLRLITLVGAGGSGKTRLALEIGRALVEEFEQGVWFVDLAPLSDAALVPQQIAKALGVQEQPNVPLTETLVEFLRERELLLILDNCEHLLDACARIAQSLISSSPVSILATSREGLNIAGEQVYPVAPLAVPRVEKFSLAHLAQEFSAVRLFVERARLAQPQFILDDVNAAFVIQICTRLDGIPLAIELAAARVKQMQVREIAARLDQRFDLLVGARTALPRQQTLRALMDWSHDLLNDAEKILFRRVSAFAGGWTIERAEEICADDSLPRAKILDTLLRLVDKSLVILTDGDETRYTMLETIREYARENLRMANELEPLRAKHYRSCTAFAERADAALWNDDEKKWMQVFEVEHNNLRAALEWSIERATPETKLGATMRLAGALAHFWNSGGYIVEGEQWLHRALNLDERARNSAHCARALTGAGSMAWRRGDFEGAIGFHSRALELYRANADWWGMALALNNLGVQSDQAGDSPRAIELYQEGLTIAREKSLDRIASWLLNNLGTLYMDAKNLAQAKQCFEECLVLAEKTRSQSTAAFVLHNLGDVALYGKDFASALNFYDTSLRAGQALGSADLIAANQLFRGWTKYAMNLSADALTDARAALRLLYELGERPQIATALDVMAVLLAEQNHQAAARLFGAAEKLHAELHYPLEQVFQAGYESARAALSKNMGAEAFEHSRKQGQSMSLEKAVNLAFME